MKTNKAQTSLQAFQKLIETKKLSKRRKEVAEALFYSGKAMTSAMLEKHSGIPRCTICGRLNELVEANVVRELDSKICERTGQKAKYYSVVETL